MEDRIERRKRLRKKHLREVYMQRLLLVSVILIVGIIGVITVRNQGKEEKAVQVAAEQKTKEENEEKQQIEDALNKDIYGEELRELYEVYPQIEELLLNREAYPDEIVKHLITHPESVDWVVQYPEYMEKTTVALETLALEPILEDEDSCNGIPRLYQWDERWGYLTYNTAPIAIEGCGPTCLSMIAVGLTGNREITPKVVADISMENNCYVEEGGSSWALMTVGAEKVGLASKQLQVWNTNNVKNELSQGHPLIFSLGPGDFTDTGHFIVVSQLNEDGTVMVNDPNSAINSEKSWEIQTILDQAKGMWSFQIQ